ncbi:MAG: hypothetical protein UD286_07060 [Bacteroidales bacterium]|nr:hypothetical protein [Bacteroidales bacterium]
MKRIIVLLSLVLLSLQVYAQDIITKKDGTTLNVKVLTATSKGIKYMIPSEQPVVFHRVCPEPVPRTL